MIAITPDRLIGLQGDGGVPFTAFTDALLRTHGACHGVAHADVETNIRTNIPDGGVDTRVRAAMAADGSGWFDTPTVWQYKGTGHSGITTTNMLAGNFVQERIQAGDAFRLAIADSMPADKRARWEEELTVAARAINAATPPARVVTADELTELANRYPGLVLGFFQPGLTHDVLHLEAWGANVQAITKIYVPVPQWAGIQASLTEHLDFRRAPAAAVRTVQGEAGIGKTRTAFEVVSSIAGAKGLAVYCNDEAAAQRVARELANSAGVHAIVVADECGPEGRHKLHGLLSGHADRVRVIAIDNSLTRSATPDPELSMDKMPFTSIDAVLDANFPDIPDYRRRAYARLSEGFPRLAADLCRHDAMIADVGEVGPALPEVGDYLRVRLTGEQLKCLAALSLLTKVGHAGDVATEMDRLCGLTGLDRQDMMQALREMHDGPGFATRAGRYFYVTPEIVAQVAFEEAWRRWVATDVKAFLDALPAELVDAFLGRVWRSGSREVRRECADYFRQWANSVAADDLRDLATVDRLVALTDTDPAAYLPVLRDVIERGDHDDLRAISGSADARGRWGPRRALVWLAERIAQFPEFFADAERILVLLASAESEPDITNNATGIWQQLFRIQLSGTATPFPERLEILRERLRDEDERVREVARLALNAPIDWHATRTLGPPVVAGRIPPAEWRPRSRQELAGAVLSAMGLLREAVTLEKATRDAAVGVLTKHLRRLMAQGVLTEVRDALDSVELADAERVALLDSIDAALRYDVDVESALRERLLEWRTTLIGQDLHGRTVAVVGRQRWGAGRIDSTEWDREVADLADEFTSDIDALGEELSWLNSADALSAGEFGEALGRRDVGGVLIEMVLASALRGEADLLARGYAFGLVVEYPVHAARVAEWLDQHENEWPERCAAIAVSAGKPVAPLDRVLRLFDRGQLPVGYLAPSNFGRSDELSPVALVQLYERLAEAAVGGDRTAERIALDGIARMLPQDAGQEAVSLLAETPPLTELLWQILEAAPVEEGPNSYWWGNVAAHLGKVNPERAAEFAARLLGHGSIRDEDGVMQVLNSVLRENPRTVMDAVGRVMLDENVGWRFHIGTYGALFDAIPDEVKKDWLAEAGVEGARKIARHLEHPHVDDKGHGVVPPFTEWVLTQFESDDRVFREFVAATHSFKMYSGDIAAEHEQEAAVARRFLSHGSRRIREWAAIEEASSHEDARRARQWTEEQDLP